VARVREGEILREAGITAPIVLLSPALPEDFTRLAKAQIEPAMADPETLGLLAEAAHDAGLTIGVYLKVDTGMGRVGCRPEDALSVARFICGAPALRLSGLITHFPVSDSLKRADVDFTRRQIDTYSKVVRTLREAGIDPGIVSAANSGAILNYPEARFDMVRPGILCYGYYPSAEAKAQLAVKPVMELRAKVMAIKEVEAGTSISYGRTWKAKRKTRIATLAVGYGDGLPRSLSNKSWVTIGGNRFPLVGRICMDQCMADIGDHLEILRYDSAVLFGPEANQPNAGGIAAELGTISYEITTGINARVPRIYVD
jgi:alanine racemase